MGDILLLQFIMMCTCNENGKISMYNFVFKHKWMPLIQLKMFYVHADFNVLSEIAVDILPLQIMGQTVWNIIGRGAN